MGQIRWLMVQGVEVEGLPGLGGGRMVDHLGTWLRWVTYHPGWDGGVEGSPTYLAGSRGRLLMVWTTTPLNKMVDTCETITFPHTMYVVWSRKTIDQITQEEKCQLLQSLSYY